jgi:pseudoazurin
MMLKLKSLIAVLCCTAMLTLPALLLQGCSDHEKSATGSQSSESSASSTSTAESAAASAEKTTEAPVAPAPAEKSAEAAPATKPASTASEPAAAATAAPAAAAATPASQPAAGGGATHVVHVQLFTFVPQVIFIKPGDTVEWVGMQSGHNSASIEGMIPEGAEAWRSVIGQNFSITLTKPGAYIYKCEPHFSLGMLGAIVVGDTPPANLAAIENSPENKGQIGVVVRKLKKALEKHK